MWRRPLTAAIYVRYAGLVMGLADEVEVIVSELRPAQRVLFVTGAGISVDSGLPTYRGVSGLYTHENPVEGLPIEVLLSGEMFARRPELTWKYLREIEQACRGAQPNAGHRAIAALEPLLPEVWVLTQNVDGLHRAAGSNRVIEIHGTIHKLRCTNCAYTDMVESFAGLAEVPTCPHCQAVIRPDVVLFGEWLGAENLRILERELAAGFDVVCSIGTSSPFPYIVQPVALAREQGNFTVEINPGTTAVSTFVDIHIKRGASEVLTAVLAALGG